MRESDTAGFMADVLQASLERPVIVDFWAEWCGPCKQLGPLLEAAVRAHRGAVQLVKIDIDKNQELAAQLQIQSVPTVYAFFQGRPVDGFQGALPESQLRSFVERIVRASGAAPGEEDPIEILMNEGYAARNDGQHGTAAELFLSAYNEDRESARAKEAAAEHIRSLLDDGAPRPASTFFEALPAPWQEDAALAAARSGLELAQSSEGAGDEKVRAELLAAVEADGNDHESRYALAAEYLAAGEREQAGEALLEIVARNRGWNEQQARKQLVKYFEAWGEDDPLTAELRRRLAALLFA